MDNSKIFHRLTIKVLEGNSVSNEIFQSLRPFVREVSVDIVPQLVKYPTNLKYEEVHVVPHMLGQGLKLTLVAQKAIELSRLLESTPVTMYFQGIFLTITSADNTNAVQERYETEQRKQNRMWLSELAEAEHIIAHTSLKLSNKAKWEATPMDEAVRRHTENWAKLMQHAIESPLNGAYQNADEMQALAYGLVNPSNRRNPDFRISEEILKSLCESWAYGNHLVKYYGGGNKQVLSREELQGRDLGPDSSGFSL